MIEKTNAEFLKLVEKIKNYRIFTVITGLINFLFITVSATGFISKTSQEIAYLIIGANIIFLVVFIYNLWKMVVSQKEIMQHPLYNDASTSVHLKALNEIITPLYAWQLVAGISLISLFFIRAYKVSLPILIYIAIFSSIGVLLIFLFGLISKASKEVRDDELMSLKSINTGYFGYYLGLALLLALQLTFLWMPEFKILITNNFKGHEIDFMITLSIALMLLSGFIGRLIAWLRYR